MQVQTLIVLFFVLAILSCGKDDYRPDIELSVLTELKSEYGISYTESLNKWKELKNTNGNSYVYQTTFTSWTGFGNTTELKIEDGVVISRRYVEFQTDQKDGTKTTVYSYEESANELGTHTKGSLLLSIDDLYETCVKNYLIADPQKNTIFFETDREGLMTLCGFVPDGCADDCYVGVRINSFDWL